MSKVHSSQGNIPFSWENQPGISKVKHPSDVGTYASIKLPPPPCQSDSPTTQKILGQDIQVPLPPCPFQSPVIRSSSRKGLRRVLDDDPFLAAYKECTKSVKQGKLSKSTSIKKSGGSREGRIGSLFSCKHSCGVREDSLVKRSLSSLPAVREKLLMDSE
ncbi:hypothetical protein AQUCO_00600047v1 [Aquilegia coerulea]|uniref:Uncharacterized protein n=1 Tax=Aquilegia coerulea TaxID=218851 RepID=A0A2G5EMR0_AQUCA|nr:hypothetical protein AQUCO_00600047v1 [Aquilegia coerulea]